MRVRVRGFGDEVVGSVRRHVEDWRAALPGWCEVLDVSLDADDSDNHATVVPGYQYRTVAVALTPNWLASDQDSRRDTVLHELGHVLMAPADAVVARILKAVPADRRRALEEEYEREQEAVVSDFAHICQRLRP